MLDWELVAHGSLKYTLLYAGATVACIALITRSETLVLSLVLVGLVLLLFVAGGSGHVRMGTNAANAQAAGLRTSISDPFENRFKPLDSDLKILFYAIGLIG